MSIRKLFDGKTPYKIFAETPENIRNDAESLANVEQAIIQKETFIPQVDFSNPENFAKYGSAESYYADAITRIYEDYPYDGSSKEKNEYLNNSTYLDLWILENRYPRTNGYITLSALNAAAGPASDDWRQPVVEEYVSFVGGPHTASSGMAGKRLVETFDKSNIYDTSIYENESFTGTGTRESNLKTNFDNGVTVEFWLNKGLNSLNGKEAVFDLWNSTTGSSNSYGRLSIIYLHDAVGKNFQITAVSGTAGIYEEIIGPDLNDKLGTFEHYAFRIYNSGSDLSVDMFINGNLNSQDTFAGQALGEITGSLVANIGALKSEFINSSLAKNGDEGWGKLSGSIDEFRFWKSKRTSQDIGRYWFDQVNGGTNTDIANTDLGVYFKFNEGITGDNTLDSTVLDYSGRITNGSWTGYNTSARSTDSAIVLSNAAPKEFKDPIIYQTHPDVISLSSELQLLGSSYDVNNFTSLFNTFPNWIAEQDVQSDNELKRLSQIMSSFFDTLYLQIEELNKLKDMGYIKEDYRELPFADKLLTNYGFIAPEIFADASLLNQILERSEDKIFEENIEELKNTIYKNIYNNIVSIYKSKGTSKAFRNLVRCYGVDENLIRVNAYANNLTYNLKENKRFSTIKKKFVDFYNEDNFYGSIYQQTSSDVPLSTTFISASSVGQEDYTSFTLESEIILPKKRVRQDYDYFPTSFQTASIMGFHSADPVDPADLTWAANDYDFQVYTVMPPNNGNNKDGYFLVTSSYYGVEMTSSVIDNLYDNKKWNLSLVVSPLKTHADLVSGSSTTDYNVKFYAVNAYSDFIQQEISLQETITTDGEKLLNTPKRIYAGSHRQNFTGSVIHPSDIRLSSVRYWASELSDDVVKLHAENSDSFGPEHPLRNVYNFVTSFGDVEIPQLQTLALHWRFDQITSSDNGSGVPTVADAGFTVVDFSSGSAEIQQRYGWLGNVVGTPHTARGDFFYPNETKVINNEFVPVAIQQNPEIVSADNTVKVFNAEDREVFTKQTRPTTFTFSIEKSMYAAITTEILNYFATILDFNNLIGDPVNRYRQEYKALGKLRQLFFEKVQNEPDVERYIQYYKWVDDSLGQMLMNLFPASADKQDGIRNVIESHALERNKYWNKYPTVDLKQEDPETGIRGINELTYNWKNGHHPVSGEQDESCFWWKERAERDEYPLATGDAGVDNTKTAILNATLSVLTRKYSTPVKYTVQREKVIKSGLAKDNNIRENVKKSVVFGKSDGLLIEETKVKGLKDCIDDSGLGIKKKVPFELRNQLNSDPYATGKGDFLAPFSVVTSSVAQGYQKTINDNFKSGFGITNLHIDSYVENSVPMQGPFTDRYVGGNQHRHIGLNQGSDDASNRPEAWSLEFQTSPNAIKLIHQPVDKPRAMLYRGLTAKRPLNIRNIKTDTDTGAIGNYTHEYEVVQTAGRTKNNSAFVKAGGFSPELIPSPYVAGMDDYAKPQRGRSSHVFVNRFSAPGDPNTMGDNNGGPGLDVEAAEYSPYNAINYRNFAIREPLVWLYASHVNQFGFYSDTFGKGLGPSTVSSEDYSGTGSIYQVNRNAILQMKDSGSTTVTASVYDNFFVQHPIPRTDKQYSWITASMLSYDSFGYLPYDGEEDLVTFSSASDFISRVRVSGPGPKQPTFGRDKDDIGLIFGEFAPTTYNWLNINTREPLEYVNAFIGFEKDDTDIESTLNDPLITGGIIGDGKSSLLNSLLLKRSGPYQHSSWKQTRGNQNPLVKKWNSSNLTAYSLDTGDLKVVDDSPVISKYKSLQTSLTIALPNDNGTFDDIGSTSQIIKFTNTFGNDITIFSNDEIGNDLLTEEQSEYYDDYRDKKSSYAKSKQLYVGNALQDTNNFIQGLNYFSYSEQIYPKSINMYSRINRERVGYKNTFWRDVRENRSELGNEKFGGTNSQGYQISQSAWSLDTSEQFSTGLSTYIALSASIGKAGELQNDYTYAHRLIGGTEGEAIDIRPSPMLSRKHMMGSLLSVMEPRTIYLFRQTGSLGTFNNALLGSGFGTFGPASPLFYVDPDEKDPSSWPTDSEFNKLGHVSVFGGNAKFEAHEQAGYFDEDGNFVSSPSNPFYDKYEYYNQIMRIKNKDMSIIPEFRISDNVEKYLKAGSYSTTNTSSYSIFGVNENNTETVTYTDDDGNAATYDIQTSKNTPQNSGESNFYKIYSHSDFMEHFDIISEDHDGFDDIPKNLTLKCTALKKFIAYDGFYPAERTLQIAEDLKEQYFSTLSASAMTKTFPGTTPTTVSDQYKSDLRFWARPFYQALISPGILYNTIKSGIAVDYPTYTGSYEIVRYFNNSGTVAAPVATDYTDYYAVGKADNDIGTWHTRIPFEAILNPEIIANEGIVMPDMEPHPSASLAIKTKFSNTPDTGKYNLAMNNFLAETVNFFLEENRLTEITSKTQEEFLKSNVESGKKYGLRIKIKRSTRGFKPELTDYPVPQEYFDPNNMNQSVLQEFGTGLGIYAPTNTYRRFTFSMYSRPTAFGPPLAGTGSFRDSTHMKPSTAMPIGSDYPVYDGLYGFNVSHTPPYYNGESWVDVLYTASDKDEITLDDIFASSSVICWRVDGHDADTWKSGDDNTYPMHRENVNAYAMQLTSSINIFNKKFVPSATTEGGQSAVWSIQTKFETPMLNFCPYAKDNHTLSFANRFLDDVTLPNKSGGDPWDGYAGQTTTPLGIWHQFGLIPRQDEGVFLEVGDIPQDWLDNRGDLRYGSGVRSLSRVVGFNSPTEFGTVPTSKKLGKLKENNVVSEAVVAVPFYFGTDTLPQTVASNKQAAKKYFKLRTLYNNTSNNLEELQNQQFIEDMNPETIFDITDQQSLISDSLKIRDKYVFPPEFDYFRNKNACPVAMYIFEFSHSFDKDDLSYIWQNIAPKFGSTKETPTYFGDIEDDSEILESVVSHPLFTEGRQNLDDLKGPNDEPVQWMIFKVKQRAKTEYKKLLVENEREKTKVEDNKTVFNWPYDYFSLIEFAKVDSKISYGIDTDNENLRPSKSRTGLPSNYGQDVSDTNSSTASEQKRTQELITAEVVKQQVINAKKIK